MLADTARGSWRAEAEAEVGRTWTMPPGLDGVCRIAAEAYDVDVATEWEPHAHPVHELVWVRGGTLTNRAGGRVFTLSEGFGIWLPAGEVHAGRTTAGLQLFAAFFDPARTPVAFTAPTVVVVRPLLQSLLVHLARPDLDAAARARAESVVFDVLEPSERELAVRLPQDERVLPIAEALLTDPADERSLADWVRDSGASARTVSRAFRAATGLSFGQWRTSVRIHHALGLLTQGVAVQEVSDLLGYRHPSTFIDAFRRVMGRTPGTFAPTGTARHLAENMAENMAENVAENVDPVA